MEGRFVYDLDGVWIGTTIPLRVPIIGVEPPLHHFTMDDDLNFASLAAGTSSTGMFVYMS